jgi:hypothetical protein
MVGMDERIFERTIERSARATPRSGMILFSSAGIFGSTLFWIILRAIFAQIGGVMRLPLLCICGSVSLLPLSLLVLPIASRYLRSRRDEPPLSMQAFFRQHWKHVTALFLLAIGVIIGEVALGVLAGLWCGFESIPVVGTALYILSSWVPTLLVFFMIAGVLASGTALASLGAAIAQNPYIEQKSFWIELRAHIRSHWLARTKLLMIGLIPLVVLYCIAISWTMKGVPQNVEFCASFFRVGVFSLAGGPLFMFFVHMSVEADRYVQWLTSRKNR